LHQWDAQFPTTARASKYESNAVVVDEARRIISFGVLCGTTHDEIQGRISLLLEPDQIIATLQQMMEAMTSKFSPYFDNIPLRAKLYLSRTNNK
jgi:hypothetical protein